MTALVVAPASPAMAACETWDDNQGWYHLQATNCAGWDGNDSWIHLSNNSQSRPGRRLLVGFDYHWTSGTVRHYTRPCASEYCRVNPYDREYINPGQWWQGLVRGWNDGPDSPTEYIEWVGVFYCQGDDGTCEPYYQGSGKWLNH
jgi:hypothetical protein